MGTDIVRTPDTLAGPCKFFGDIVAYQRNQEAIHPGLWDAFNLWERLRAQAGGKEGQPGRKPGGDPRP